jgi:hypothetical protein
MNNVSCYTTSGWFCGNCGMFVLWGNTHVCPSQEIYKPNYWYNTNDRSYDIYDRIDRLEKRIRELEDEVAGLKRK